MIPAIRKIQTTDEWLLIIYYENGEIRSLDFTQENLSGSLAPLKNIDFFKKAYVSDYGMVEFPNDIQLDPVGLYEDSIPGDIRKNAASKLKILAALKKIIS
jgi:hypothetical protein